MKIFHYKPVAVLIILALLNIFSQQAYSFSAYQQDLDSRDYSYLQADQNRQGAFFQEIGNYSFSHFSENDSQFFSGLDAFLTTGILDFRGTPLNRSCTAFLQDHRKILKHQIFPYHFFW